MPKGLDDAALAVRDAAHRAARRHQRPLHYADVVQLAPLRADIHDVGHVLDADEDLELSTAVRHYDKTTGLALGDTLVVHDMANGDWVAVGVVTANELADSEGGEPGPPGADGTDGTDGADGLSAYELWLAAGHAGTLADFLDSLVGPPGPPGSGARFDATIGDGTATSVTSAHGLGVLPACITVYDTATGQVVEVEKSATTANVTITQDSPIPAGGLHVVVTG